MKAGDIVCYQYHVWTGGIHFTDCKPQLFCKIFTGYYLSCYWRIKEVK